MIRAPRGASMVHNEWTELFHLPTPEIIRRRLIVRDIGEGVLWSSRAGPDLELSAFGAMAWEDRESPPDDPRCRWVGFNLLCNAAPTPFTLNNERFWSVDSFHEALKLPEGSAERAACATARVADAKRLARRRRASVFAYQGGRVGVESADHDALIAAAIVAKVSQHPEVQRALRATGLNRLVMSARFSKKRGSLARVTPAVLMLERWKRFRR